MANYKVELDALILAWNFFYVPFFEFVSSEGSGDAAHKLMHVWVLAIQKRIEL